MAAGRVSDPLRNFESCRRSGIPKSKSCSDLSGSVISTESSLDYFKSRAPATLSQSRY